VNTHFASKCE